MGHWTVAPANFQPDAKRDQDGTSFFREDFCTPKRVAAECKHPAGAWVVRLRVAEMLGACPDLQLDVIPDPDLNGLPGHAIPPMLKYVSGRPKAEKRRIKDCSQGLARLASKGICYIPPGLR